jgi:hypothetical protein
MNDIRQQVAANLFVIEKDEDGDDIYGHYTGRGDSEYFVLVDQEWARAVINDMTDFVEAHTRQARIEGAKFVEERLRAAPKDSWYGTLSEAIEALQHPASPSEAEK